jgi:hypothetical protein
MRPAIQTIDALACHVALIHEPRTLLSIPSGEQILFQATTINGERAEPAERICSASSVVSALNVVPCGGIGLSDMFLA